MKKWIARGILSAVPLSIFTVGASFLGAKTVLVCVGVWAGTTVALLLLTSLLVWATENYR